METINGKIITILANFYYVQDSSGKVWECFARGRLLKEGKLLFVGDDVEIELTSTKQGVIVDLLSRKNKLDKPPIANIDQVLIVFSSCDPEFDLYNLDRYLSFINYELPGVRISICINKIDLKKLDIDLIYKNSEYEVIYASAVNKEGLEDLSKILVSKTTVLTGPSGVGKSSLIKALSPELDIRIGDLSSINKGKQTTRNVNLIGVNLNNQIGFLVDTPGFSQIEFASMDESRILDTFNELNDIGCEFANCLHLGEEGCNLETAKIKNNIVDSRIDSYLAIISEAREEISYGSKIESKSKATGGREKEKNKHRPKIDLEQRSKSRKKEKQELLKFDEIDDKNED